MEDLENARVSGCGPRKQAQVGGEQLGRDELDKDDEELMAELLEER